jgi:signal transduction histidine kinase
MYRASRKRIPLIDPPLNRVSVMDIILDRHSNQALALLPVPNAGFGVPLGRRSLRRDTPDVAEGCEAALRTIDDAARAAELIDRVRSLCKRETSDRELLDINEIIQEMIILVHDKADRTSISIRTGLASGLPRIIADRVQLQQVLMNLLLNGIEAMKDANGELTVRSKRSEDGILSLSCTSGGRTLFQRSPFDGCGSCFAFSFRRTPGSNATGPHTLLSPRSRCCSER